MGNHIYEFFGPRIFSYKEFYNLISKYLRISRFLFSTPFFIANFIVFFLEKTRYSLINREKLKFFNQNNIAVKLYNGLSDLGVTAQDTKEVLRIIIKKNL